MCDAVEEELIPLVLKKEHWEQFVLADDLRTHLETIQFIMKEFKARWCKLAVIPIEVFHASIMPHVARRMLYEEDIPVPLSISKPLMYELDDIPRDVGNVMLGFSTDDEQLETYKEQSAALPRRACVVNFFDFDTNMDGLSRITVMPLDRRTMDFLETRTKQDMVHDIQQRIVLPPALDSDGEEDAYQWPEGLSSQRLLRELENWYTFLRMEHDLVWRANEFEAAVRLAAGDRASITVHQKQIGSTDRYVFIMRPPIHNSRTIVTPPLSGRVFMVVDVHALEINSSVWSGSKGPIWDDSTCNLTRSWPSMTPRNIWCLSFDLASMAIPEQFSVVLDSLVPSLYEEALDAVSRKFVEEDDVF